MNEDPSELSPEELARAERIAYLVTAFVRKDISPEETDELDEWVGESDHNVLLFEQMTDEKNIAQMMAVMLGVNPDDVMERVNQKIAYQTNQRRKRARKIWTYAIAAVVTGIIATVIVVNISNNKAANFGQSKVGEHDIAPGGNKAILTLADGNKITLTDAQNGKIATQGIAYISKTGDGQLLYSLSERPSPETEVSKMNTIETPRGGQYQLTLSDGTKVWLNAASSIVFPAAFNGKVRIVELKGEGYFEVAKDPGKPFHVKIAGADIEVLGTHFNVNGYKDESAIKTTLLEGSLKVTAQLNSILIRPGEQAKLDSSDKLTIVKNINTDDVIGWKSGMFSFHREDIKSIMRQVQRWYDVDVQYRGGVEKHFTATIERNVPVSKLLNYLEGTEDVHFSIENKTIIVKP